MSFSDWWIESETNAPIESAFCFTVRPLIQITPIPKQKWHTQIYKAMLYIQAVQWGVINLKWFPILF